LQRLQLDAEAVGHVADADRREVRLPGLRAEARELGDLELDLVRPADARVRERVEALAGLGRHEADPSRPTRAVEAPRSVAAGAVDDAEEREPLAEPAQV